MTFPISIKTLSIATLLGLLTSLALINQEVRAMTIVRNFTGGNEPINVAGGGNLVDIFNAAADLWEESILDEYTMTINYSWSPLDDNSLGINFPINQDRISSLVTEANVRFDNNRTFQWFLDATPNQNEEYLEFSEFTDNLGAGEINTGRIYGTPTGDAVDRFDLFTVALHEIGHSLGILDSSNFFTEVSFDNDIDLKTPRPFAGTEIPATLTGGGHLDISTAVMFPFIPSSSRKLLSEIDILGSAEISDFSNLNLNPQQNQLTSPTSVPENTSIFSLLAFGFTGASLSWLQKLRKAN